MLTAGPASLNVHAHDFSIDASKERADRANIEYLRGLIADYRLLARAQRAADMGEEIEMTLPERIRAARVLSKQTNIYFMSDELRGLIKIGRSGDVGRRLRDMRRRYGRHVRAVTAFQGPPEMEECLHRVLKDSRAEGEWFAPSSQLLEIMAACAEGGLAAVIQEALDIETKRLKNLARHENMNT